MYAVGIRTHLLTASLGKLVLQLKNITKKIPPVGRDSLPALLDADTGTDTDVSKRFRVAMGTGERKRIKWRTQHDRI